MSPFPHFLTDRLFSLQLKCPLSDWSAVRTRSTPYAAGPTAKMSPFRLECAVHTRSTQYAADPTGAGAQSTHTVRSTQLTPRVPARSPHTQYAVRSWPHGCRRAVHTHSTQYAAGPNGFEGRGPQSTVRSAQPEPNPPTRACSHLDSSHRVRSTQHTVHKTTTRTGV